MTVNFLPKYQFAKTIVMDEGYSEEVLWQSSINYEEIDESTFMREIAWVILSAGMKEQIIRNVFPIISKSFFNWESAKMVIKNKDKCMHEALRAFNNKPKIRAIVSAAEQINDVGFNEIKSLIYANPIEILQSFSFIGPITVFHLAKNIGLPVAKPDRHLKRIATMGGYSDVQLFCGEIAKMSGDSVPVVDIILWRFATIETQYLNILSNLDTSHENHEQIEVVAHETPYIQ